jgi:hypothetical protein
MEAMVAEILPSLPPPGAGSIHGLVAGIKGFTLWLGGSLAGITALLYTTGYLVTRSHLNLLGLYGIVDFGHDYFIQEGAKFFRVIGYSYALSVVLPLLTIAGIAGVVLLALGFALRKAHAERLGARLKACFARFEAGDMPRVAAFAVLLFGFLLDADQFLVEFQVPLCVANLLYADSGSGDAACGPELMEKKKMLEAELLHRDAHVHRDAYVASALNDRFATLVYATAKTALLAYLMWKVVMPWRRWRLWLVAPPLVAVCFYTVSLPLDYAVLQRPVIYPRIKLTLGAESQPSAPSTNGPLFLLSKTASDFVIWDASVRRLVWIPSGSVKRVEVIGVGNLFAQEDSPANRERNK